MSTTGNAYSDKLEATKVLREGIDRANRYKTSLSKSFLLVSSPAYSATRHRPSSVLVVLKYNGERAGTLDCWDVLLTLRPTHMRFHGGLVCLPGGKLEKGEDEVTCALREANEEVSLNADDVEVIGTFEPTVTLGNVSVCPVISILRTEDISLCRNPSEVEDIFWMPLSQFVRSDGHREGPFSVISPKYTNLALHFFDYCVPESNHIYTVWGLTARVLMLTACMAFDCLPNYIEPSESGTIQDPLFLGYIPRVNCAKL